MNRFQWGEEVVYTDEEGNRHAAVIVAPDLLERFHFIGDTYVIELNDERLIVDERSLSPRDPQRTV
jgi:hypothetical protein